jgi:hypothetical protein
MNDRDIHVLAGRLNAGWVMIGAEPDDAKRARLEDYWLVLLHAYEAACDQAAGAQEEIAA